MVSSSWWGRLGDRLGPRWLLLVGSGFLFNHLLYLFIRPTGPIGLLIPASFLGGALNAAWIVGANQLLLRVAPTKNRSFFVSAHNFTNGWLMAGGPLLGGLLADYLPVTGGRLPGGLTVCYFHVLVLLATVGGLAGLAVLMTMPRPQGEIAPAVQVQAWRMRLTGALNVGRTLWRRRNHTLRPTAPRRAGA
jgi:MFS family permease